MSCSIIRRAGEVVVAANAAGRVTGGRGQARIERVSYSAVNAGGGGGSRGGRRRRLMAECGHRVVDSRRIGLQNCSNSKCDWRHQPRQATGGKAEVPGRRRMRNGSQLKSEFSDHGTVYSDGVHHIHHAVI